MKPSSAMVFGFLWGGGRRYVGGLSALLVTRGERERDGCESSVGDGVWFHGIWFLVLMNVVHSNLNARAAPEWNRPAWFKIELPDYFTGSISPGRQVLSIHGSSGPYMRLS